MQRRNFLKLASLAGLSLVAPVATVRKASADPSSDAYTGNFYVLVNAGGGWDPTFLCDPKGDAIDKPYTASQILSAGNIQYAPLTYSSINYSNQQFFEAYYNQLVILNGIDTTTNNHDSGTCITWSSQLTSSYPTLGALIAGALAPTLPTAFISNGGYDFTADVVPLTRVNNLGAIQRIAYPNLGDPNNTMSTYQDPAIQTLIAQTQAARLTKMKTGMTLPNFATQMGELFLTRSGNGDLQRMIQFLPSQDAFNKASNFVQQAMVAFAAYQAGISVAVNINTGGFDTHGNHDTNQANAMGPLLQGIDQMMQLATTLGIAQNLVVIVGSDFGRTPSYNATNGKDHWTITSMMMMGAGITGNRVLGATDAGQLAVNVDINGAPTGNSTGGAITPGSIHRALRQFAGVDNSTIANTFPLPDAPLNFLM